MTTLNVPRVNSISAKPLGRERGASGSDLGLSPRARGAAALTARFGFLVFWGPFSASLSSLFPVIFDETTGSSTSEQSLPWVLQMLFLPSLHQGPGREDPRTPNPCPLPVALPWCPGWGGGSNRCPVSTAARPLSWSVPQAALTLPDTASVTLQAGLPHSLTLSISAIILKKKKKTQRTFCVCVAG